MNELVEAVGSGDLAKVKSLVENGTDVHYGNESALRYAGSYGQLEVVKYLVSKGADIHADNDDALIWARVNGYMEVVKYLKGIIRLEERHRRLEEHLQS